MKPPIFLSNDIVPVQPLSQPTGNLFYMDFKYKKSIHNITLFIDGVKIIPSAIYYDYKENETTCLLSIEFLNNDLSFFSEKEKNNETIKEIKVIENKNIRLIKFKKLINPNYNMEKEMFLKFNDCVVNGFNITYDYVELKCDKFEIYKKINENYE